MVTESDFSLRIRPWPAQVRQGLATIWPWPWQLVQVRSTVKKPWLARSRPVPWQAGHWIGLEPFSPPVPPQSSQATEVGTRTVACLPVKASSSSISRL